MFGFNREHESDGYRASGTSALEEDLSLLRRRMIQAGKCYCLLVVATLAWLLFTQTLDSHPHMLESISFTKFNLNYSSFPPVQDILSHFKPVEKSSIPPLSIDRPHEGTTTTFINGIQKPVERITLSRIVGRKYRLNDRKPLKTHYS
ncbi:hypothetical protein PCASD_05670 [Puccinia coronata f. sp. avenae]|uniref:Uncharacterized protein n=1 Tax=Puccinia coronata f. sp. avenae TaxID=200324 RepID=A0A2N5UVT2_9BASI|nr:hypothetical protein PCASD_14006 [Puccinia coronata f. sp. avenae]PLW41767.1 hypothetical protein PCASD_05670 [Puccinia coronata f. sp. avenae]